MKDMSMKCVYNNRDITTEGSFSPYRAGFGSMCVDDVRIELLDNSFYFFNASLSLLRLGSRFISGIRSGSTPYSFRMCNEFASPSSGSPPIRSVSKSSDMNLVRKVALNVGPPILKRFIILRTLIFFFSTIFGFWISSFLC